jgi:hypothetical protein
MPNSVLVWVDPQPSHTLVYVDHSLVANGKLHAAGIYQVDTALSEQFPNLSLATASTCRRPLLWHAAG